MTAGTRNRFLPWIIGLVIIAIADIYVATLMFTGSCEAPGIVQFLVVVVVPGVYLALMYLTFKSQA
ncbi:MAG: hypothetical protein SGJ07_00040 [Rhodospirillaceae bacterium]|nr:hypothetical protein [Rhodospirillaceae bacterium]